MTTAHMEQCGDRELVVERLINAPRERVWQALTDPRHIVHWWGPKGWHCDTIEIDIREGGVWRFTMLGPDGLAFRNRLQFEKLEAPALLTFKHDDDGLGEIAPFDSSITLEAQGDKTRVLLSNVFDSLETRKAMEEFGAVEGGQSTLQCLEEYLSTESEK